MLKVLEKSPLIRWKFVQRLVHRQRTSRRSGNGKFKTFCSQNTGDDTSQILSPEEVHDKTPQAKNPFNAKRRIQKVNERDGFAPTELEQESNAVISATTTVTLEASPGVRRRCYSDDDITKLKYDGEWSENDEIDTSDKTDSAEKQTVETVELNGHSAADHEPLTKDEEQSKDRTQYNPIAFQRSSGLRRSFKDWKRRSMSRLDTMKQSMRRRSTTRKYEDLDQEKDELVKYEESPGVKRRQVIEL